MFNRTIATTTATIEQPSHSSVSYDAVTMPAIAALGGMLILSGFLVKALWMLSVEKNRIDNNEKAIAAIQEEKKKDDQMRSQLREEVKEAFKADIASSAFEICHRFEVFAVEIRASIDSLKKEMDGVKCTFKEGLDARNQTITRLYEQTGKNSQTIIEIEAKLNQAGVPFQHRYRLGDDPPSIPKNYS